jgi:cellulose synthase/poly-beta-1,6-N-acetylglucosamine synthase-like glycosyltransferase
MSERDATANLPQASVVIITHNGAARIRRTLHEIECQTVPPETFEVVVVDDGSTDGTADVVEATGVRVIRLPHNQGPGAARNAGLHAAAAEIVVFIDDDCLPAPTWLQEILAAFTDPSVDGVGGRIAPLGSPGLITSFITDNNPWVPLPASLLRSYNRWYRLLLYLRSVARTSREPDEDELFAVAGGNMAFRRSVLEEVGGFDSSLTVSEETDLCWRLHRRPAGARLVYRRPAEVSHQFTASLRGILRRARWYGQGTARMARTHDEVGLIIYPFPLLVAAATAATAHPHLRRLRGVAPLLPLATYLGWTRLAARRQKLGPLTYPYLQMAMEISTMAGEAQVLATGLRSSGGKEVAYGR